MQQSSIRQDVQVRKSGSYIDTTVPSEANFEINTTSGEDDFNNVRSQIHNLLKAQAGNWWDALNIPAVLETGIQRGVNDLNDALHVVEKKRVLREPLSLVDVTVGTGDNFVILGVGELPLQTTAAVGVSTTLGTVVASHGGTFGTHALSEVSGTSAINPSNLMFIVDGSSRDSILSGGNQVYGLLQGESGVTDGGTITATTTTRVQVSFVRFNASGDGLEAVPVADIEDAVINYSTRERVRLEDLDEADFLGVGSSAVDAAEVDFVCVQKPDATLTYAAGFLTEVDYADGRSKTLSYNGANQLIQVICDKVGGGQLQKDLVYNLNGTLASVTSVDI